MFFVPEITDESVESEEREVQPEETEAGEPAVEDSEAEIERSHRTFWPWLLLLGTGAFGIWLWLFCNRKRTVCGTVLDGDGNAMRGIRVSLMGQEEEKETQTDRDGRFLFNALEKDDYRLCICGKDASSLLLLDIRMESGRNKKVFAVLKSNAGHVETKQSGRKYQIDVTA